MPFFAGDYVYRCFSKNQIGRIQSRSSDGSYIVSMIAGTFSFCESEIRLALGKEIDQFLEDEKNFTAMREKKEQEEREKTRKDEQKHTLQSAIAMMDAEELWESIVYYRQLADLHNDRLKTLLMAGADLHNDHLKTRLMAENK